MLFNFWRKYPFWKPKKAGWYQCTVMYGSGFASSKVMDLYFTPYEDIAVDKEEELSEYERRKNGNWIDYRRQQVFQGYKVYKPSRAAIEDNRVWEDNLCERIDVVAWRKLPNPYKWRKEKDE